MNAFVEFSVSAFAVMVCSAVWALIIVYVACLLRDWWKRP